ncbi:hypothetical protein Tco_1375938 [Tanacetum coccineum]
MTSESSRISSPSPIKESAMRRIKEIRTSSKALRFAKIVQDKKIHFKEQRGGCDDDHSCSISQEDSKDDESVSMYNLGASLGITLDGKPARLKNDMFSNFLLEVAKIFKQKGDVNSKLPLKETQQTT